MSVKPEKKRIVWNLEKYKGEENKVDDGGSEDLIKAHFHEGDDALNITSSVGAGTGLITLSPLFEKFQSKTLRTITVSQNAIINLNVSEENSLKFPKLSSIIAQENSISKVSLVIRTLKTLDLTNNVLTEIPDLNGLPNLQTLKLEDNYIESIPQNIFDPVVKSLMTLDLAGNNIQFNTKEEADMAFDEIKKLEVLTNLSLMRNPFTKSVLGYKRDLCLKMRHLKEIDDEDVPREYKKRGGDQDISLQFVDRSTVSIAKSQKPSKRKIHQINELLQRSLTNPTQCTEFISEVAKQINEIVKDSKKWDEFFPTSATNNDETAEAIEIFLERCLVLIENQASVQAHLIACLANLTIVNKRELGKKCFHLLAQFLESGSDAVLRRYIKESVTHNILVRIRFRKIAKLKEEGREELMLGLISGLNLLINSSDMAGLFFKEDYLDFVASWIEEYKEKIIKSSGKWFSSDSKNDWELYDEILE